MQSGCKNYFLSLSHNWNAELCWKASFLLSTATTGSARILLCHCKVNEVRKMLHKAASSLPPRRRLSKQGIMRCSNGCNLRSAYEAKENYKWTISQVNNTILLEYHLFCCVAVDQTVWWNLRCQQIFAVLWWIHRLSMWWTALRPALQCTAIL